MKARSARAIAGYKVKPAPRWTARTLAKAWPSTFGGGVKPSKARWTARKLAKAWPSTFGGGGFNEADHPRKPAGTAAGGEFRKK